MPIPPLPIPTFPPQNRPQVWLLTSGASPLGLGLARALLPHGDYLVLCVSTADLDRDANGTGRLFQEFLAEVRRKSRKDGTGEAESGDGGSSSAGGGSTGPGGQKGWGERVRVCAWDGRITPYLDTHEPPAIVGTVEELSTTLRAQTLVREQFETNFFGPMAFIKAALPAMRERRSGHVIVISGITGHLGTPGLGMYCAAGWALEGFCDSLAYEIAPFSIKLTIVQTSMEIGILTNKITAAPPLPQYATDNNPAPLFRGILSPLLRKLASATTEAEGSGGYSTGNGDANPANNDDDGMDARASPPPPLSSDKVESFYPAVPDVVRESLVAETVHALTAIGGHDNPPARHIVGFEGIASVKEKLKTVSEELEDFIECSAAVDIGKDDDGVGGGGLGREERRASSEARSRT
ncbi:MAG: hypothetical protein M1834_000447 [Cirrosporium novae-zelandiae]|nr:MAG: hypothetical protein M1834_000447 [Cirrosporium novae-zelandiae]